MNKFSNISLEKRIKKSKIFQINPIESKIITTHKRYFKTIAINEISLLRQSKQTAMLKLKVNGKILIKKLISDGVLVSTPAGSTAYNLSVNGPILSLNSKKIAITPISPFRPRRRKGKIISDKSEVLIENLKTKLIYVLIVGLLQLILRFSVMDSREVIALTFERIITLLFY